MPLSLSLAPGCREVLFQNPDKSTHGHPDKALGNPHTLHVRNLDKLSRNPDKPAAAPASRFVSAVGLYAVLVLCDRESVDFLAAPSPVHTSQAPLQFSLCEGTTV